MQTVAPLCSFLSVMSLQWWTTCGSQTDGPVASLSIDLPSPIDLTSHRPNSWCWQSLNCVARVQGQRSRCCTLPKFISRLHNGSVSTVLILQNCISLVGGTYSNHCAVLHYIIGGGIYSNHCAVLHYIIGGGTYSNHCAVLHYIIGGGIYSNHCAVLH